MARRRISEEARRAQILAATEAVARREGLDGLAVDQVAAEAGVSKGIIFFYFKTKEVLMQALLDRLLETVALPRLTPEILALSSPTERLLALVRQEIHRIEQERPRIELFFDYWVRGVRDSQTRHKIRAALQRYRATFLPLAEQFIAANPGAFRDAPAAGLAGVAVSFIEGCAVQAVIDPANFDVGQYVATVEAVLSGLERAPI